MFVERIDNQCSPLPHLLTFSRAGWFGKLIHSVSLVKWVDLRFLFSHFKNWENFGGGHIFFLGCKRNTVVFVFVVFAVSFLSLSPLRDIICNPFQTNVSLSLISFQISMCYFSFSLISFQIIKFPSAIFTPWSVLNDKWGHSRQFNLWTYFHQSRKILGNDGGEK